MGSDMSTDSIKLSGVTLDCPNARHLANFYAEITDGTVSFANDSWAILDGPGGRLEFQTVPDYQAPRWPEATAPIQMHLDFYVEDRAATEVRVVAAGATKYAFQPNNDHCSVFADPAGHAFCLSTWGKPS